MHVTLKSIFKHCLAAIIIAPIAPLNLASGDDGGPPAVLSIPTVKESYTLDGKFDEAFWKTLPEQNGFRIMDSRGNPREGDDTTSFRVALCGETLLLGIVCQQRQEEISLLTTDRNDTAVCADDSIEVFLTTGDEEGHYQLAVNTKGYLFDQWVPHSPIAEKKPWNGAWEAVVHVEPTQWSVEMAIPLAALNYTTAASLPWRLNVARTMARSRLYQSWAPVARRFAEWERHPSITFADKIRLPATQSRLVIPTLYPGTHRDEWVISLPVEADHTYTVKSSLRAWQPGPLPPRETRAQHLAAKDGELRFPLEIKIPQGKQLSELIFEVIDETNSQPVTLLYHTFYPPKLLEATMPWSVWFNEDGVFQLIASINASAAGKKKGELQLALINSDGKTVEESLVHLDSRDAYPLQIATPKLSPDLYKVEITLRSEDAGEDRWTSSFQLVYGPFSKKSLPSGQAPLSPNPAPPMTQQ